MSWFVHSRSPSLSSLYLSAWWNVDMGVPDDGQGLTGVVTSGSYRLEEKRRLRDEMRLR